MKTGEGEALTFKDFGVDVDPAMVQQEIVTLDFENYANEVVAPAEEKLARLEARLAQLEGRPVNEVPVTSPSYATPGGGTGFVLSMGD